MRRRLIAALCVVCVFLFFSGKESVPLRSDHITFWCSLNQKDSVPNIGFQHIKYFYTDKSLNRYGIYNLIRLQDFKNNNIFMQSAAQSFHQDSLPNSFNQKQVVYSGNNRWVSRSRKSVVRFKGKVIAVNSGLSYKGNNVKSYHLEIPQDNFYHQFSPSISWIKGLRSKVRINGRKSTLTTDMVAPSFSNAEKLLKGSKDLIIITFYSKGKLFVLFSYKSAIKAEQLLLSIDPETGKQQLLSCKFIESVDKAKGEREQFRSVVSELSTEDFDMQILHGDWDQSVRFYSRFFWMGYASCRIKYADQTSGSCIVSVIAN